ncbi:MAG: electron transfer flavoprotein subunit alpha/FixB family protein, partial [Deltaproteobacteria bacterium]
MGGVWVYAEVKEGAVKKVAFEILGEARKMASSKGEECCAVLVGQGVEGLAPTLGAYGADKVFCVEGEDFARYTTGAYTKALYDLVQKEQPSILLF